MMRAGPPALIPYEVRHYLFGAAIGVGVLRTGLLQDDRLSFAGIGNRCRPA
jgi:hypothetical protein